MPEFKGHEPGTFCYAELLTTDPPATSTFYRKLFGWDQHDNDMGEHGIYSHFEMNGAITGAQYKLMAEQKEAGVPPHWGVYVAVADVDAATKQAREIGANVLMEPFDVSDVGRMSVLQDPQGAAFNLWQEGTSCGVGVMDEPGAMCWQELMTPDTQGGQNFYTELFGWQTKTMSMGEMGDYTIFTRGEKRDAGGMVQVPTDKGPIPPHWLVYFQVSIVDEAHELALKLGAKTIVPPTDIPSAGRFAVIQDPVGAVFGIYKAAEKS